MSGLQVYCTIYYVIINYRHIPNLFFFVFFSVRKNQVYDEVGLYLENSNDICDCLNLDCPGCHFPCPKCGSEKCGQECRCCRRYIFETIEIEGTKRMIKFPEEMKPSFQ